MTSFVFFKDLAAVHKGENGNAPQANEPHTAQIAKKQVEGFTKVQLEAEKWRARGVERINCTRDLFGVF